MQQKKAFSNLPKARQTLIVVGIMLLLAASSLSAEIFRPVQIFLPGNLAGRLTELDEDLKMQPSTGWKIPDTIDAFKKDRHKDLVVFGTGNDSDIFAPLSYLDSGRFERELIERCQPEATGISPADLETFNSTSLDRAIRRRVFTNLDSGEGAPLFSTHFSRSLGQRTLWFFNFIEPGFCKDLPGKTIGTAVVENPTRSLLRMQPDFQNNDISISILYAGHTTAGELSAALKKFPGCHFIVQIPFRQQPPLFSTYSPEQDANVYRMSLRPGHQSLPLINVLMRNYGPPRLTLRMLPLAKSRSANATGWHRQTEERLKPPLYQTLKVVKTTFQASSMSLHLSMQSQAHLLRICTATDIALVIPPETRHINDNIICTAHILLSMPNDRVHRFRISGAELLQLSEALIKQRGIEALAFSGCDFNCLGGQVTGFKVGGQQIDPGKQYMASTTGKTLTDPVLQNFLKNRPLEAYDGQTVWNCWKNSLKTIRISDEHLFD